MNPFWVNPTVAEAEAVSAAATAAAVEILTAAVVRVYPSLAARYLEKKLADFFVFFCAPPPPPPFSPVSPPIPPIFNTKSSSG